MKKTLILLAITAILTSCGQSGEKTEKATDSTVTEVLPGETLPCDEGSIDPLLIPLAQANTMIQTYHDSIKLGQNPNQNVSFQLDAVSLRCALINNPQIEKLDVYLATGADGKMTLVYIGAYDSAGYWVEQPYTKSDGTQYAMDHVYPCPTCPRIAIHNHPGN